MPTPRPYGAGLYGANPYGLWTVRQAALRADLGLQLEALSRPSQVPIDVPPCAGWDAIAAQPCQQPAPIAPAPGAWTGVRPRSWRPCA
jgi:hypothetical protein